MSKLERVMTKFREQANIFRNMADILYQHPKTKAEADISMALAEVADGLADMVKMEIASKKIEREEYAETHD